MSDTLSHKPTVAVITSTIGRPELERAILSVQSQTYPCKHYVFVDGADYVDRSRAILEKFPNVVVTYLPMNTGKDGWTNSSINAIAPFLVEEDIICYLDDDNWYESHHVADGVKTLVETGADYAYAVRKIYDNNSQYVCEDTIESIGCYENKLKGMLQLSIKLPQQNGEYLSLHIGIGKPNHIDTNCYFMTLSVARKISLYWHSGLENDANVFKALNEKGFIGKCTKIFSVNYIVDIMKFATPTMNSLQEVGFSREQSIKLGYEMLRVLNLKHLEILNGKYPWETE